MAIPSALTLNYDAVLSTTLFNYHKNIEDQISTSNFFLYKIMKMNSMYETVSDLGDRAQIPLMYALGTADSYSGYDQLDTTPMDGITSAFWNWAQCAIPIAISGLDEKKNSGSDTKLADLLKAKTKQAVLGIQDYFGRALLQGNGPNTATAITTGRTSPNNGSVFIDPLALLVKYDPTTSTTIGNINQSTYSWWQNQSKSGGSGATTYAGFLTEISHLFNQCSIGPGGSPDVHLTDQSTFEFYEGALRSQNRYNDYRKADIPFENLVFRGQPVTWDQFIPDVKNGTITQSTASGTWYMINSQFWSLKYHSDTNFTPTPFIKPENQDAKVAQILWLGALTVSNRRKHGVLGGITTTIAS